MLYTILILLIIIAAILMVLTVIWNSLALGGMDIILWLVCAIGTFHIEIPYTHITSTDTVLTGVNNIYTLYVIAPLFVAMAVIMLLYLLTSIVMPYIAEKNVFNRML